VARSDNLKGIFLAQIHSIGRLKHAVYTAEDEMPVQRPLPSSKVHIIDNKAQLMMLHARVYLQTTATATGNLLGCPTFKV
jgi:hypothetical protein